MNMVNVLLQPLSRLPCSNDKNDQLAYFNIKKNKHIEQFEIISRSFCFVISNHKGRLRFTDKLYH